MFELLNKIPINIWSVVLGSIIAFGGILISNRSQSKRLSIQLSHDSKLKVIERKAAMRRDVYLNAAEELVKANGYLGSLAQIDLTKTNVGDGLQAFFASTAKLGLVAEEETGKALNELVIAYSGLLFKLIFDVMPISEHKNKINILNEHHDDVQTEIKRIIAEMNRYNESGTSSEDAFNILNNSFKFQQERAKELTGEIDECWKKVNEYTKKFALLIANEMKEIALLQVPVMVGIRKELDIDTNVESYIDMANKSAERIREQLDNCLVSLDNKV